MIEVYYTSIIDEALLYIKDDYYMWTDGTQWVERLSKDKLKKEDIKIFEITE